MSRGLRTTLQLRNEVARLEALTKRQRATINRLQDAAIARALQEISARDCPAPSSSHSRRGLRAVLERARLFIHRLLFR